MLDLQAPLGAAQDRRVHLPFGKVHSDGIGVIPSSGRKASRATSGKRSQSDWPRNMPPRRHSGRRRAAAPKGSAKQRTLLSDPPRERPCVG